MMAVIGRFSCHNPLASGLGEPPGGEDAGGSLPFSSGKRSCFGIPAVEAAQRIRLSDITAVPSVVGRSAFMLRVYFGELREGRLARLPYLGYWALLALIMLLIAVGIGFAVGMAQDMSGGDMQQAQTMLQEKYGLAAAILLPLFGALLLFANLNIMAKRIRDIGLPGWLGVLALVVVSILLSSMVSQDIAGLFDTIVWVLLLVMPGGSAGEAGEGQAAA
ncbi:MAG TPA: DUF805 domain-containing protein [Sedimenticola sp.]|nr:DUF805 domain-containing protein [Sedimenticola sp.]